MRHFVKFVMNRFRLGFLARSLRSSLYSVFDYSGSLIFKLLRICSLLPKKDAFDKKSINKILIIRLDRIGDVILSTPAIRALRFEFPAASLHLLIEDYTKDLVINNPHIDKLIIYKHARLDRDYDLAVALHPGFRQNYLAYYSGAKHRIGYCGQGGSFFLTKALKDDRQVRIRHEIESALEIAALAGAVTDDRRLEVSVTTAGEVFADNFFKYNNLSAKGRVVLVHPGARQEYIRWKKEGFAEVCDELIRQENAKVILLGSRSEKNLIEQVSSLMKEKPIFALGLDLTQVISLIKRCSLFIGNSTGPMHIAAASGVPVVAVFGNIHPLDSYQEWGPWGKGHIIVSKDLDCQRCHPSDCPDYKCMDLITSQEVISAVKRQLSNL